MLSWLLSAHVERAGRHQHGIAVAEKTVGLLVSGHADVDFHHGVVRVLFTPSLVRRLRHQNAASLDHKRVNTRQPFNGGDYARPIFGDPSCAMEASMFRNDVANASQHVGTHVLDALMALLASSYSVAPLNLK